MNTFHQYKLSGHRDPILCLAHSSKACPTSPPPPCCLLSGSEDGTMRCWDLRSSKASLCIISPNTTVKAEVTSVAFYPSWGYPVDVVPHDTNNTRFALPFTVFMSVGSQVYGYDLRKADAPIVRTYDKDVSAILQNKDEINQICLQRKQQRGKPDASTTSNKGEDNSMTRLATADDAGDIRITTVSSNLLHHTDNRKDSHKTTILSHIDNCNTESSIPPLVTCMEYRPRVKEGGGEIVSGATDCTIRLWDINKPQKPINSFHIPRDDEMGVNQMCNPPIVHSVSWSSSGKLLACGLGDGSTLILSAEGRQLYESYRIRESHTGAVAVVLFPSFGLSSKQSSLHIQADDRLLVSAGNDGNIFLWDLGMDVAGGKALDPYHMFHPSFINKEEDSTSMNLTELHLSSPPKLLFGVSHQRKPNCLVSNNASDAIMPASFFVADTTNNITIYNFPVI